MGSKTAVRKLLGLPEYQPLVAVPPKDPFQSIQDTLMDFRAELRNPMLSKDPDIRREEELSLLDAGEEILSGVRGRIFFLIRNSSIPIAGIYDLVSLYNRLWDRLWMMEQRLKVVRLLVGDIKLVHDKTAQPEDRQDDPYEQEGVEYLPTSF